MTEKENQGLCDSTRIDGEGRRVVGPGTVSFQSSPGGGAPSITPPPKTMAVDHKSLRRGRGRPSFHLTGQLPTERWKASSEIPEQGGADPGSRHLRAIQLHPGNAGLHESASGQNIPSGIGDHRSTLEELPPFRSHKLGHRKESREVTDFFAGGSAMLLLAGGALSAFWFRRVVP